MSAEYLQNARYWWLALWAIRSLLMGSSAACSLGLLIDSRRRYRGPSCTAEYVQAVGRMIYDEPGMLKAIRSRLCSGANSPRAVVLYAISLLQNRCLAGGVDLRWGARVPTPAFSAHIRYQQLGCSSREMRLTCGGQAPLPAVLRGRHPRRAGCGLRPLPAAQEGLAHAARSPPAGHVLLDRRERRPPGSALLLD